MKYMKIGTRPDIFHTEEATRSVASDVPSDLTIIINNTKYLLHKFPILPKCGLLQRLHSDISEGEKPIEIDDIPGGEEAFELCAKFCYEIVISLSAHNFVSTFCAAKFLKMTESVEKGNFVSKLEHFFHSFILHGWKDSIEALETTAKLPEWSENLGIIRSCVDSIVEKILTPPSKVTWSYTYTRPGYAQKPHRSVPRDWWTEDISNLDIELFRCIIASIRSLKQIPPQLVGEALHVYASRWLPQLSSLEPAPEASVLQTEAKFQQRRILNSIGSMIPTDKGSVSVGFLLKLLKAANLVGSSPATKGELIRRAGQKLDEASVSDLLFLRQTHSNAASPSYDMDLVGVLVESFLMHFRDQNAGGGDNSNTSSLYKVAKLIDQYLQVLARTVDTPVSKFVSLAESLPEYSRPEHDELYKAINTYLKEHPEVSKGEKKRLCQVLDCGKLSASACMHALRNERLPLRTLVQLLFIEQARTGGGGGGPRGAGITRSMADAGRIPEIGRTIVRQAEGYRGGDYGGRDADGGLVHRRRGKTAPGHQRGDESSNGPN